MTPVYCCAASCLLALAGAAALVLDARVPAVVLLFAAATASLTGIVTAVHHYRSWQTRMLTRHGVDVRRTR